MCPVPEATMCQGDKRGAWARCLIVVKRAAMWSSWGRPCGGGHGGGGQVSPGPQQRAARSKWFELELIF
jgi:hypothetical protein